MWSIIKEKINSGIENNVPWKEISCRGRPVWMNREIMRAIRKKKRLWKNVKGKTITAKYMVVDKNAKRWIRNAKIRFEKILSIGDRSNNRLFFAHIKKKTKSRLQ
jgi:hypothetical protein